MRSWLLLFSLLLLLSSCVHYRNYPDLQSNYLTDMTFAPHNNHVELFFKGESEPSKNYLRVALVKQSRTSYSANPGRLLQALQNRTKFVGEVMSAIWAFPC